jgi:hypothetical protein
MYVDPDLGLDEDQTRPSKSYIVFTKTSTKDLQDSG